MSVSTQLRLITKVTKVTKAQAPRAAAAPALRGRAASARRPARGRPVHWEGQWRLDERTRAIGRAGVASARAALAAADPDGTDLRRAS